MNGLTPERFSNTITLPANATHTKTATLSSRLFTCSSSFSSPVVLQDSSVPSRRQIMDVPVPSSPSSCHLHLLVDAAIRLPRLLYSAKCQTVWQHQRSLYSSSGTLFLCCVTEIWHYQCRKRHRWCSGWERFESEMRPNEDLQMRASTSDVVPVLLWPAVRSVAAAEESNSI